MGSVNKNIGFNRNADPYEKLGIGKRSGEDYFWKKFPYKDCKNVIYLKTKPIDLDRIRKYRAVMYQGGQWDQTGKKWSISIEIYVHQDMYTNDGGWDRTPGSWYLETLLHEDSYSSGPISDIIMIDGGQGWGVENMIAVLDEAKKIRDEYINKNTDMRESILMPRFNFLNEDHHKECSDEVAMAKIQLKSLINDAGEILQSLDKCEQLDAWVQSKLSIAEDYITTVRKYMQYEEEEVPEELPLIPSGGDSESDDIMMDPISASPAVGPDEDEFDMDMDMDMDDADNLDFGEDGEEAEGEPDEKDLELFSLDDDDLEEE
jgi:hypothetical protein